MGSWSFGTGPESCMKKGCRRISDSLLVICGLRRKSVLLLFLAAFFLLTAFSLFLRLLQAGEFGLVELAVVVCIGGFELGLGLGWVLAAGAEFLEGNQAVAVGVEILVLLLLALGLGGSGAKTDGEEKTEDGSC